MCQRQFPYFKNKVKKYYSLFFGNQCHLLLQNHETDFTIFGQLIIEAMLNRRFVSLLVISILLISCENREEIKSDREVALLSDKVVNTTPRRQPEKPGHNQVQPVEKKRGNSKTKSADPAYNLRKYDHVRDFYSRISGPAIRLCVDNNVPPAAVLAIAGLESGWNRGYVGRITGNILSLGAGGNDPELPALRLPRLKSNGQILFDSLEIIRYKPDELTWEKRPPSLKKDYRPKPIAGTRYQLAYFKYHKDEKARAQVENINDFLTGFISRNSRIRAYRRARHLMDSLVSVDGKPVLFEQKTIERFINTIGGHPNSFNFRKTWPRKVMLIVNNAGLAMLSKQLYLEHKNFNGVW